MAATYTNLARALGKEHGKNAASWCFDGNTSRDHAARMLQMLNDGDPEVYDHIPSPDLSGQWADGMTPDRLCEEIGVREEARTEHFHCFVIDALCNQYEDAFSRAAESEFVRLAKQHAR